MGISQSQYNDKEEMEDEDGIIRFSDAVAKRLLRWPENERKIPAPSSEKQSYKSEITNKQASDSEFGHPTKKQQAQLFEDHYHKQVKLLKQQDAELKNLAKEEFIKTVFEIENKYPQPLVSEPICKGMEAVVVQCYSKNPTSPLNCSHEVKKFAECVRRHNNAIN